MNSLFSVPDTPLVVFTDRLHDDEIKLMRIVQMDHPMHWHTFNEIVYVEEGQGIHQVYGHAVPIQRGDLFVIPPGVMHGYSACQGLKIDNLVFNFRRLSSRIPELGAFEPLSSLGAFDPASDFPARHIRLDEHGLLRHLVLINQLEFALKRHTAAGWLMAFSTLSQIIVLLTGHGCAATAEPEPHAFAAEGSDGLHGHGRQKQWRKVQVAAEILREGRLSIKEVARTAGFSNSSHLARAFRQHLGCTPSKWVQQ